MTAADLGPAPGLVNEWLTPGFVWLMILIAVLALIVRAIRRWRQVGKQLDADLAQMTHRHQYRQHDLIVMCACGDRQPRDSILYDQNMS